MKRWEMGKEQAERGRLGFKVPFTLVEKRDLLYMYRKFQALRSFVPDSSQTVSLMNLELHYLAEYKPVNQY